jgi:hypothetical protein
MRKAYVMGMACGMWAIAGCASSGTTATSAPAANAPAAVAEAPASASAEVFMGPTKGASDDPMVHAWQSELLGAIGRPDQFALFQYVLVGKDQLYIALDSSALGLSATEASAAMAVQDKFAPAPVMAATRANLWVAPFLMNAKDGAVVSR